MMLGTWNSSKLSQQTFPGCDSQITVVVTVLMLSPVRGIEWLQ